jgi:hypothetical protein
VPILRWSSYTSQKRIRKPNYFSKKDYFLFSKKKMSLLRPDFNFERSCSDFAFVISLIVPSIETFVLLIVVIIQVVRKKPKETYMAYVYIIVALVFIFFSTFALYYNFPGIFCGFFLVYLFSAIFLPPIIEASMK